MMSAPLDDATVARLRGALVAQRDQLRAEIEAEGADPDGDEVTFAGDRGFADRSHSTEERSRAISLVRSLRATLRDVERALGRIDAGTYGTCERCGRPIAPERLEALPWTSRCIDHAGAP